MLSPAGFRPFLFDNLVPMLTHDRKVQLVQELEDRFRRQQVLIFTNFGGISVAALTGLRRELGGVAAEFKVAKKTLLKRTLDALGIGVEPKALEGEIGVVFGYGDQVAALRATAKFSKLHETFRVLAGVLDGKILTAGEVLRIAQLPSRDELLGGVARVLCAPIQGLVNALQGNIKNLVVVIHQIIESQRPDA